MTDDQAVQSEEIAALTDEVVEQSTELSEIIQQINDANQGQVDRTSEIERSISTLAEKLDTLDL